MSPTDNDFVEALLLRLVRDLGAKGAIMIVFHQNDRAEVIAGLSEEIDDLPGRLQRLADRVRDGDGHRIGNDGKTFRGDG